MAFVHTTGVDTWWAPEGGLRINEAGVECLGGKDRDHHQRHAHGSTEAHGDDCATPDETNVANAFLQQASRERALANRWQVVRSQQM